MDIFAVIGLGDTLPLKSAIDRTFADAHYSLEEGHWFVAANGETAKSIAEKLGMTSGSDMRGVILTVGGYYGLAPADIWEWRKAKMSTVHA